MASSTNTVGFNANTSKHLVLDAGAFYVNYGETVGEKLIGATQGGGEFHAVAKYRQISVDGVKGSAKGLKVIESWEVTITANFLEITTDILKMALGSADVDITGVDSDVITARTSIVDADYIKNVAWIGKLSGSAIPVVIKVLNALSTDGLKFATADNAEGIIPVKFEGHFDPSNVGKAPFEISYPKLV